MIVYSRCSFFSRCRNDHQGIININQTAQDGEHLLHVICRIHNISDEILQMILQFPGINVNCKNDGDTTPLHYFVQHNHSVNCQGTMYAFHLIDLCL